MRSLFVKHRGWLIACFVAVAFSMIVSPREVRDISTSRLQGLIKDQEVASITVIESKAGNGEEYTAEITLTSAAMRKYGQFGADFPSSAGEPHFVCSIGNSREEVKQWREKLSNRDNTKILVGKHF